MLLLTTLALAGPVGTDFGIDRSIFGLGGGQSDGGAFVARSTLSTSGVGVTESGQHAAHLGFRFGGQPPVVATEPQPPSVPARYALGQNRPNPFNPTTTIRFALREGGRVRLDLFDAGGRVVRTLVDDVYPAGEHAHVLDGSPLPSGVYWYRLTSGTFSQTRRMVLVK